MNATSASPAEATAASAAAPSAPGPTRRVIDAPTRALHWLMALSFLGAFVTADGERWRQVHVTLGYTLLGLVGLRLIWGLLGPRPVRLSVWWGKLGGWRGLWPAIQAGRLPLQAGQNILQAATVLGLMTVSVLATASGYVMYEELLGGRWTEALEEVHEVFGDGMMVLVVAHLALVLLGSILRRQNQALTMITGRVAGRGPDLVRRNLSPLALLLLIAVISFWVWQWQTVR